MPRVRLLEQAARESIEAAAWYERERAGLGRDFAAALEAVLDLIEEGVVPLAPMPAAAGTGGTRRIMLRRFPYDVVVQELPGETLIVAVAHQSRRPGYWVGRLG
jgi:plasmid stabilization system protein ParE